MPPIKNAVASSSKASSSKSGKVKPAVPAGKELSDLAPDIDSIFAGPSKVKKSKPAETSTNKASNSVKGRKRSAEEGGNDIAHAHANGETEKKKKKKKVKSTDEGQADTASRVVEVVDTSIPKVTEVAPAVIPGKVKGKGKKTKETEEDEMFADSRGTGPRRKTEEGFLIYKEAELQIDPEAGGTPLCPFDCECCF